MPRRIILLSPIAIIAVGHLVARVAGNAIGAWAWIPVLLVLWAAFAAVIAISGGSFRRWLQPVTRKSWWSIVAVVIGFMPLQIFLQHWRLMNSWPLLLTWLLFAAINPLLEEGYWRGALLDAMDRWPGWLATLYSSTFFALNHTLTLGVNSIANRHPVTLVITFILGVIWATAYRRTGTLRFAVIGHTLVDLLNLSVLAFLNLYVPRALPG